MSDAIDIGPYSCEDRITLYSPTFGEGTTLKEFMILSGYSSRILEMSSVPIPDPVPPPNE